MDKQILTTLGVVSIILTIVLFYISGRIRSASDKVLSDLFHSTEFTASQNMMYVLKQRGISPTLTEMRNAYIPFFALLHDGKGPTQEELNKIADEATYLKVVNQDSEKTRQIIQADTDSKKRLEFFESIIFGLLITVQSLIALITVWFGLAR